MIQELQYFPSKTKNPLEFTIHKRTSQQVAAFKIGNLIQQNIHNSNFKGKVLAVFSNTIYLQDNDEEVYWIADRNLSMHRRCILADVDHQFVESGMTWSVMRGCLQIGKDLLIDLESAELWTPYLVDPAKLLPLAILPSHRNKILTLVPSSNISDGFARVLQMLDEPSIKNLNKGENSTQNALLNLALPTIKNILTASKKKDVISIIKEGEKLLGLGPGLTPSGDDFLGGLIFTARHLNDYYKNMLYWNEAIIDEIIHSGKRLTNQISLSILSDLARMYGPEPLHNLVTSILIGNSENQVREDIEQLTKIGHSSGWDMLLGVLTAMQIV